MLQLNYDFVWKRWAVHRKLRCNEKERKRKQEEEIYNQCILDKVPDAKTEVAAKLLEDSCKQISINPTNWQIIKYLGVDGLKQIID